MQCHCSSTANLRRFGLALLWLEAVLVGANFLVHRSAYAADATPTAASSAPGHAEALPGAEENPNPLVFKTDLAIWTFVVFLLLFFVLKKFAWGPISESLD